MLGGLPHARGGLTNATLEMIRCDLLEASRGQPLCADDAIDKSQVLLVVISAISWSKATTLPQFQALNM